MCFSYLYILKKIVKGNWKWKKKVSLVHSRLSNFLLANRESCRGMVRKLFHVFIYMLWFNFILGLIFISLCFKLIITHYHAQKQRKIKIKPRIKLNHNIYNIISVVYQKLGLLITLCCCHMKKMYGKIANEKNRV